MPIILFWWVAISLEGHSTEVTNMSKGIVQVHAKVAKGHVIVLGMGQTNRSQRFIRAQEELGAPSFTAKEFKPELAAAIVKMLGESP